MRVKWFCLAGITGAATLAICLAAALPAEPGGVGMPALNDKRLKASEFPAGFAWLNTQQPLEFSDELKGRVVVLDFWTYCCINCIHMIPVLKQIEERYADQPVVVLGVHSNKFENEGDAQNVRTSVLRYKVSHPVVVDEEHRIWDAYGVNAWPTFVFIDAQGRIAGAFSGERPAQDFIAVIDELLKEGREAKALAQGPPKLRPEAQVPSSSGLAFPGKVLADATGKRLFIADSNHNRVIETTLDGEVQRIFGSGQAGLKDGASAEAQFQNPQGMALDAKADLLFVADTDNHALREIDLKRGSVRTLAGNGMQGNDRTGGKTGTKQLLSSPWDVAIDGGRVFIAMAGLHQIWVYERQTGQVSAWSGSGREEIFDGPANRAALAQPSGLAILGSWLYFADSEVSAVRRADLKTGDVETIIGKGLFVFGDGEGPFARTLFQHPLGVAALGQTIFVADTYNHKIKRIDLGTKRVQTVAGNPGDSETASIRLYEPGGLSGADSRLFVADTNNHRIVVHDLRSGEWGELALRGWKQPTTAAATKNGSGRAQLEWPVLQAGQEAEIHLKIDFPEGVKLNPLAPMTFRIVPANSVSGSGVVTHQQTFREPHLPLTIRLALPQEPLRAEHDLDLTFAYCTQTDASLCAPVQISWRVLIETAAVRGASSVTVEGTVPTF